MKDQCQSHSRVHGSLSLSCPLQPPLCPSVIDSEQYTQVTRSCLLAATVSWGSKGDTLAAGMCQLGIEAHWH